MKYLVNTRTKEHIRYNDDKMSPVGIWRIVESDEEGWIPWKGGDCPLPDACKVAVIIDRRMYDQDCAGDWGWRDASITAYRPILETAEKEEPRRHGRTIVYIPESQKSVFDRLKSAIAASESIPAIIAEIDALLPEGYFVSKTLTDIQESIGAPLETDEDISDWRNWREGDILKIVSKECGHEFDIGKLVSVEAVTGLGCYCCCISSDEHWYIAPREARFHSRPAKVTE